MEECDGRVELGKMVCAVSEYALDCIKFIKLGIGASSMASGRNPSMLRMMTRFAMGAGVAVKVGGGRGVSVGDGVNVYVAVITADGIDCGVGYEAVPWQARILIRSNMQRSER